MTAPRGIARQWFGTGGGAPIILLHEGLGSVSTWGPFPRQLSEATGRRVLTFDRRGYGRSMPHRGPWSVDFMHREARELALLLAEEDIDSFVLVGHSDGATIALLFPHELPCGPVPLGIVSISAHVFVEDRCVVAIEEMKRAYHTKLAHRLARHHHDADAVFEAWSEIWTSNRFRSWTIDAELSSVTCPVLAMQGLEDTFATGEQLERIAAAVLGPVELLEVPGADHWPHREATELVLAAIERFCRPLG